MNMDEAIAQLRSWLSNNWSDPPLSDYTEAKALRTVLDAIEGGEWEEVVAGLSVSRVVHDDGRTEIVGSEPFGVQRRWVGPWKEWS